MARRTVFFNPHVHGLYRRSVYQILIRYHSSRKFGFVLDAELARERISVLIDECETSLPRLRGIRWIARLEFWLWCKLNRIDSRKVEIVSKKTIRADDVLILSMKNINEGAAPVLQNINCMKVLNTNNFMTYTKLRSKLVKQIGIDHYWSESKLEKSDFFQKFFGFHQPVSFIPFAPQKRFQNRNAFQDRLNRCLAMGSVYCFGESDKPMQDLREFYGVDSYHPFRQILFDSWREIATLVDVRITPFEGRDSCLKCKNDPPHSLSGDYFDMDLVELMNQYKLVIYAEEINDTPALGMYEAMKCGCVIVGSSSQVYTDIGLVADESYISFGEKLEPKRLLELLEEYLAKPAKLNEMAKRSYEVAQSRIGEAHSAKLFQEMVKNVEKMGHSDPLQNEQVA